MVYERRHVAKSGRADGLPASRIIFFHLTTSFSSEPAQHNFDKMFTVRPRSYWTISYILKCPGFSYLVCLAATQAREIQSKELASEVFRGIFTAHRRLVLLSPKSLRIYGGDLVDIYRTAV